MTEIQPITEKIQVQSTVETLIRDMELPPEMSANVLRNALQRAADEHAGSHDLQNIVLEEARRVFEENLSRLNSGIKPEERKTQTSDSLIAIYTGRFNPPTRGHEAFLRNLQKLGMPAVVTGPDCEDYKEAEKTPLALRKFLYEEFLKRVFPEEIERGEIRMYPEDLVGGSFPDRVNAWHAYYGKTDDGKERPVIFCAGADTLKNIIKKYPEAVLSGPIVCMRREIGALEHEQKDEKIPAVSRAFFLEQMRSVMKETGPHLLRLFSSHRSLENEIRDWAEIFPNLPAGKQEEFLRNRKLAPSDFANRLLGSERLQQGGPKLEKELQANLERFLVFAGLVTNPLELERLNSHIFYVDTIEHSDSSTRDRKLLGYLATFGDQFTDSLLGKEKHPDAKLVAGLLRIAGENRDSQILKKSLEVLKKIVPAALISAMREILHTDVLAVLHDFDLLDLYSPRPQKKRKPVSREIIELAKPYSEHFALLGPEHISRMSSPAQFHYARALAGAHYEWEHDAPDEESYVPKNVLYLLAHTGSPRSFVPSVLIDRKTGDIVAVLAAFKVQDPPLIKYTSVMTDPRWNRSAEVSELVSRFVEERINEDQKGERWKEIELMIVEVPAHDERFVEQHILGGTKFIPCGLEPGMDPSRSYILWTVQGIRMRNLKSGQGNYYVLREAEDFIRAVNDLIAETTGTRLRYEFIRREPPKDSTEKSEEKKSTRPITVEFVQKTNESIDYRAGQMSFSIYPGKSRQLDYGEFRDNEFGTDLLEAAIIEAEKLHAEGELGRPYLKIAVPIDDEHALEIQEVLKSHDFYPVRFTPKTGHMPPILTFCKILDNQEKPRMNPIQLPMTRVAGNQKANTVFQKLQEIGTRLLAHGRLESSIESAGKQHVQRGKKRIEESPTYREIMTESGYYEVFPSLYAHAYEVTRTLHIFQRNFVRPLPDIGNGIDQQQFQRQFVTLHDCGKAVWAIGNRFCQEALRDVSEQITDEDLKTRLKKYLTEDLEAKKRPFSDDWALEKVEIKPEDIGRFLKFDEEAHCYRPVSDSQVSAQLIDDFLNRSNGVSETRKKSLKECSRLYRRFATGEFETAIQALDDESAIEKFMENPDACYFLLLELIDNTSRYRLTALDSSISLRELWNALNLKQEEVVKRYGKTPEQGSKIRKKFEILKHASKIFFGS